jgi:hypothetical protein
LETWFGPADLISEDSVNRKTAHFWCAGIFVVLSATSAARSEAQSLPADFEMSNPQPRIGEIVTFTVDSELEVESWDFEEADCRGNSPVINCSDLPSGACNLMEWTFPWSGEKTVTMVLEDGRSQTKRPIVQIFGECCLADGEPSASFEMSAEKIFVGQTVYFNDTSAKSVPVKALGFTWTPANPEIGEDIMFELTGVTGDIYSATWYFGETGCHGISIATCELPWFNGCRTTSFTFASGGAKTVSVDVVIDGAAPETVGPEVVNVANTGQCGDVGCRYTLLPTSASIPAEGDSRYFDVSTAAECNWSASSSFPFISVTAGSGPGPGRVNYMVSANEAASTRSGIITVNPAMKGFKVRQAANPGGTKPAGRYWLITLIEDAEGRPVNWDVYRHFNPSFSYTPRHPGIYRVSLTSGNCFGSDTTDQYLTVLEAPVEDSVVASAISSGGAHGTRWESDFRFFNPSNEILDVALVYQPDNEENRDWRISSYPFSFGPKETRVFASAREIFDVDEGENINGSIRIKSFSAGGHRVLTVSKTFNDTPDGTLGLFVPAMPVTSIGAESLNFTGLIRTNAYRSNLRLVNHGDNGAWVKITVFQKSGEALTEGKSVFVHRNSTKQINDVAGWAGVEANLSHFTVLAEIQTPGAIIDGFATVIDNISGDSVMNASSYLDEPVMCGLRSRKK